MTADTVLSPREVAAPSNGVAQELWHVRLREDDPAGDVMRWDDRSEEDARFIYQTATIVCRGFTLFLLYGEVAVARKQRYDP